MSQNEDLTKFLVQQKKQDFGKENTVLDALRRSRKSRGLGAPLELPRHLQNAIVITDDDLPKKTG